MMKFKILISVLVFLIFTGCQSEQTFEAISTDSSSPNSDIAGPYPRYSQGMDEEEQKQFSARLLNKDKGFYVTGSLDGSGFVDFQNLTFDERNSILTGNTMILADLMDTFFRYYGRYPDSWDEFEKSPVGKCFVLYNPFTGATLKSSPDFSPGEIKTFGVDEELRGSFSFYHWEDPDEKGGGAYTKLEIETDFMLINFASEDVVIPRTEEEWEYMFIGFNLGNFMLKRTGYKVSDTPVTAEEICYSQFPRHTFIFKLTRPGDEDQALVLSEEAKPNSLSVFVAAESELLLFKAYGEDSALIYQKMLAE